MKYKTILVSLLLVCWTQCAWANEIAIQTIILEAQGESLEGQIAVGEVIRNRTDDVYTHGRYDDRVAQVVKRPYQFSCWNNHLIAKLRLPRVSGEAWQRASKAWAESEESNLTNGATHYHAIGVSPKWASGKVGKRIGNHVFYRGIK